MSDFLLPMVKVDQSHRSASTGLFECRPSMCAGIRLVGFYRTSEAEFDECFWLVNVFLHSWPFALAITSRAKSRSSSSAIGCAKRSSAESKSGADAIRRASSGSMSPAMNAGVHSPVVVTMSIRRLLRLCGLPVVGVASQGPGVWFTDCLSLWRWRNVRPRRLRASAHGTVQNLQNLTMLRRHRRSAGVPQEGQARRR